MMNAIEIRDLLKNYEKFTLEIDELNIPSGAVIGLIGENGAGKTTLIKSILNIIRKDKGNIRIFGKDHIEHELEIKRAATLICLNAPRRYNCKPFSSFLITQLQIYKLSELPGKINNYNCGKC